MQEGAIPVRFDVEGNVVEYGKPRETRIFGGRPFLMETALHGDVAILRAWKVDKAGNCVFRYTTKSFAPLMAKAAKVSIVEAENIVEVGEIDPNDVDLPGIFVDRIVPATEPSQVEIWKTRATAEGNGKDAKLAKSDAQVKRNRIAKRSAKELKHGFYVNLGVGKQHTAPHILTFARDKYSKRRKTLGRNQGANSFFSPAGNRHPHARTVIPPSRTASMDPIGERHSRYGRLPTARRSRSVSTLSRQSTTPKAILILM